MISTRSLTVTGKNYSPFIFRDFFKKTNQTIRTMNIITDQDITKNALENKTLAIIGFGSQGHAHAQNLRDSGNTILIGLYEGSKSKAAAEKLGFEVVSNQEAVKRADIIMVAIPDMLQASVFESDILPNLEEGKTLLFSHGLSVHFKLLKGLPENINVILVAPKGPGHLVRSQFEEGAGVPSLIAVEQNQTETAWDIARSWAKGIGAGRAAISKTTFEAEAVTDLFGEQNVLCGGVTALVETGYEVLAKAGYKPEMAYYECLHELKLIVDLMIRGGIGGMRHSISETAKWGDVLRSKEIGDAIRPIFEKNLREIQDGTFTAGWVQEYQNGLPNYTRLLQEGRDHPLEVAGIEIRETMPFIDPLVISDVQAELD